MEDFRNSKVLSRNLSLGIVVTLAVALILGGVIWHRDVRENTWGKISFQEYFPGYLPDGLKVTSKTIDARYTPANNPSHTTTLNLNLSKGSFVYEHKDVAHFSYDCAGSIVNQSCLTQTSSHDQRYTLTTTTVPDQPMEQTVRWVKGSTAMQVTFRGEPSQPYPQYMVGRIVDSFLSVVYQNLKVNYYDNSRI